MTVQLHPAQTTATEAHEALGTTEKVVVVTTPDARCDEVVRHMRMRASEGDVAFHLVVPAVPAGLDWLADMTAGRQAAEQRLNNLLFRCHGLPIEQATVGAADPVAAAMDAVNLNGADAVVVATTRPRRSLRMLGLCLADRIRTATGRPVEHVVSAPARHQPTIVRPRIDAPAQPLAA